MQYTAIVKNGGLFIPNIFTQVDSDINQPRMVQINLDIAQLYEQVQAADQLLNRGLDNASTPVQKINLAELPVKAFDSIDDPVAWQNILREH